MLGCPGPQAPNDQITFDGSAIGLNRRDPAALQVIAVDLDAGKNAHPVIMTFAGQSLDDLSGTRIAAVRPS